MIRIAHYEANATKDLAEIFDYLDQRSESAADKFYDAVEATVRQLLTAPELGERCRFRRPKAKGLRIWQVSGFPNYLIFYRFDDLMLTVVRVLHGARNYAEEFDAK